MADSTIEHKGKVRCVTRSRASSQENEPFVCHSLDDADRDLRPYPSFTTFTLIISVILSISALFMLGLWMESSDLHVDQTWEIRRVSTDSPILHDLDLELRTVQFNGSFLHANIFRQPAGPDVDAAWESLGINYRPVVIPESQGRTAELNEGQVRLSEAYGGGYVANVEGLHHLHCLNLLRQALYFNVDYYRKQGQGAFVNDEFILHTHITHCLDTLRQQLMCVVDVGLLGQIWWDKEKPKAFPDFNTKHKCRDFEAVRKWAEEHQVPEKTARTYLRPPRREDVLDSIP
ncbi:tat pathway signal sequence [Diplogelasinospora grovesii]|uniref:Tat pathway signal sequence n=1 Tax=Diplogelasinospora grovesii TaxID=303347 RepID=A0AAN6NCQ4_9PEZI|nr:tat pathway signal sequence [Diplogelasinospora grovesii]